MRIRIPIWSRLTRLQRLLLAAVTVVVVLFVLTTSLGARHGDGDAGGGGLAEPPGFVQWMGDLFGGSTRVDPADVSGDCPRASPPPSPAATPSAEPTPSTTPSPSATPSEQGRDRLDVVGSCVLVVAAREGGLRQLTLHALHAVRVEAPIPRGDGTAVKDLAAGDETTVSVDAGGGQITLTCRDAATCSIELT